ncbi:hypothetical protein ACFL2E_04705 [Thermodesulfobacteriota bacterium]
MSFRESLLKKIRIKFLGRNILASMGSVDSGKRTDIHAVRELLGMSPYTHHKERDLDLYVQKTDGEKYRIIVLGNDLPMYVTTLADVIMRRSPTVKEMISIRNAVKILNDTDVMVKKGPETLETIQRECIDLLDLSFKKADLTAIAEDGAASLKNAYQDGVIENLSLFGELLGFQHPPKALVIEHFYINGLFADKSKEGTFFGPMVLYGKMHNELKFIDGSLSVSDKGKIEWIHQVAKGMAPASVEGPDVFQTLIQAVLYQLS